jgi:hypothetical protein
MMNMPRFTAEQALQGAVRRYLNPSFSKSPWYDSVIPQFTCGYTLCSCSGFEDCYQMGYVSSICYPGSLVCPSFGPTGPNCTCVPAIV